MSCKGCSKSERAIRYLEVLPSQRPSDQGSNESVHNPSLQHAPDVLFQANRATDRVQPELRLRL